MKKQNNITKNHLKNKQDMKNIHLLHSQNNKSKLATWHYESCKTIKVGELGLQLNNNIGWTNCWSEKELYITSNEEIKEGDWFIDLQSNEIHQSHGRMNGLILIKENSPIGCNPSFCKKIIMATDTTLIADGVQAIPDEFLKWFVKNPSCECVDVKEGYFHGSGYYDANQLSEQEKVLYSLMKKYKITIPKEETKQGLEKLSYQFEKEPKQETIAYKLISEYYGQKTAKRSGIKLINHIDEGIEILKSINSSQDVIDAYCLHPILQSDEEFVKNLNFNFEGISAKVLLLTMEYRRVANSYLSKDSINSFVGFTTPEIKQMLYADKVQNEKDFALYHEGKHDRSKELREYFNNWLNILLK